MRKHLVCLVFGLVLCGCWQLLYAQSVVKTDASCTVFTDAGCAGPGGQGCDSTTFTVPQGETAYFNVYLQGCTKTTLCECYAVGYLYDRNGNRVDCLHSACNDCTIPNPPTQENLTAGQTYKMYVCKVSCDTTCTQCPDNVCRAYAVVSYFP